MPHGKLASNIPIVEWPGITPGDDIRNLDGFHGPNNNITITLQRGRSSSMPWLDPRVKDNAGRMHARFGDDHARNGMTYQDRRPSCRASTRSAEATASGSVVSGFCTEVALKPLCLQSGDDLDQHDPPAKSPARHDGAGLRRRHLRPCREWRSAKLLRLKQSGVKNASVHHHDACSIDHRLGGDSLDGIAWPACSNASDANGRALHLSHL